MDYRKQSRSSPRNFSSVSKPNRSVYSQSRGHRAKSHLERHSRNPGCCQNTERCKGIGAVLFTLGIPTSIAGLILTVVAGTDQGEENKYPESFLSIGPILLVFAVIFFCIGFCLYNAYARERIRQCLSLDEPTSCCRLHCAKLSQWLKPDESIGINQAAMKALQSEPGKSVLKRGILPSVTSSEGNVEDPTSPGILENGKSKNLRAPSKGVRFSESDTVDEEKRRHSVSTNESGSTLSLRHCKIYPREQPDSIWWTDEIVVAESNSNSKSQEQVAMTTDL